MTKISKTTELYAIKHGVNLDDVTPTGSKGNILKKDVQKVIDDKVHEAKPITDLSVSTDEDDEKTPPNTNIRFFQYGKRKGEEVETFNLSFDFVKTGEVDLVRLSKFVARKLYDLTAIAMRPNCRMSFSPTKPLWFEMTNGKEQIQLNLSVATKLKMFLKAKKGANPVTKHEMIESINNLFDATAVVTDNVMDEAHQELLG